MDDPKAFHAALIELLGLHIEERRLMQELRHAEHEACVERKLKAALEAERLGAILPGGPGAEAKSLLSSIMEAAQVNASIAHAMLGQSKDKIDFIRKVASTSYGKDGQMAAPSLKGGLFTGKT